MHSEQTVPWVLLAGPTASGKTALAIELALRIGGEIISADSMQIYRGCAIGTAQPAAEELHGVPCHLTGCLDPWQPWSVAEWLRAAKICAAEIISRGRIPVVVGGTGLYFKTLTNGLFETEGAAKHPEVRSRLEVEWDVDGGVALYERLRAVDVESTARIHANDKLRVVRALEVFETTGRSISTLQAEDRAQRKPLNAHRFVLCLDRDDLYHRIDARVEAMIAQGFEDEVRKLLDLGALDEWPAMRALGYPQMLRMMRGEMDRASAVEETQRFSRRYAKQQMVLYRRWWGAVWLDAAKGLTENARWIEKMLEFTASAA